MPIGRQYADAIHRIAEPREQTIATVRASIAAEKGQAARPTGYDWLVDYRAFVDPDADDPAWTEVLEGDYFTVVHSAASGIFTIVDDTDEEYLYYTSSQPTLDNEIGTVLEAAVAIPESESGIPIYDSSIDEWSGGTDRGTVLSIFDGTRQFTVWLRNDGLNINGESNVAIDLTSSQVIRFEARQQVCRIYVNRVLQQTGSSESSTGQTLLVFGTRAGSQSTSLWDYVRGRWMND